MIFPGKFKFLVRVNEWSGQRKICDQSEWERSPLSTSVTAQAKELVLVTGALLAIAILGTALAVISIVGAGGTAMAGTGAATGAVAPELTECLTPFEVVGLDNCPELESDGGSRGNSTVQKLLDIKAEILRQVVEVLADPASPGQGGRPDEPLLLVRQLAVDEADASFGPFNQRFRRAAHAGSWAHELHGDWSAAAGGFNRWVGAYYREVLREARPVLVAVEGDDVCALEKELSLEARTKAADADAEDIFDAAGEEQSSEAATPPPTRHHAPGGHGAHGAQGGGGCGDSHGDTIRTGNRSLGMYAGGQGGDESFEAPVVLLTLGWDGSGDPSHAAPGRDRSCALRVLEMSRVVRWFTSHTRRGSRKHEKFRYLPIGFGGYFTRNGLPQAAYIDAAKRQLRILETCPRETTGSFDLLFQCSNLLPPRDTIWRKMTAGKGAGSPIPVNRAPLEPADMVAAAARGIFAVSPPGTGPDCFRHYEMMLEGNIALVPDEPSLRTFMGGLPAFFFGGSNDFWRGLTCGRLLEMADTVQAKIREGKEGVSGGGLQFEKLTHGFWRRYIRREVLLAAGIPDENAVYMERSTLKTHATRTLVFEACLLAICVVSAVALRRVKRRRSGWRKPGNGSTAKRKDDGAVARGSTAWR